MGVRERIGIEPRGDKAGEMSHVDHDKSIDLVGDGAQRRSQWRGDRPISGDDQFWPVPESQIANVVEIDAFGLLVNAVGRDL